MNTEQEVKNFLDDVAQVMQKHQVSAMTAIWFARNSDDYGFQSWYDVADSDMKAMCMFFQQKLTEWEKGTIKEPQTNNYIRGVADDGTKN